MRCACVSCFGSGYVGCRTCRGLGRVRLALELLEGRETPATLELLAGALTYAGAAVDHSATTVLRIVG